MTEMNAMVLSHLAKIETNPLKLTQIQKPSLQKKDELLIEIEACGVCRSNLHLIEGDWKKFGLPPRLPLVPGHEVVGKVIEAGVAVKKIKVGDRIGIQPLYQSCLECYYCLSGREHLCDSIQVTGEHAQGGYAEFITVTEPFATKIYDGMDSAYAAPLFCPGITAYKAVKASQPALGRSLGVFGVGGVGHLAVQLAKMQGARVIGISRSKRHLDVAKKVGADNVISSDLDKGQFLEALKKEEGLLDSAVVFAPSEDAVDTAIRSVKKGGIIIIGVFCNIPNFAINEEKTIKGSVIGSRKDMEDLVQVAKDYDLKIITRSFPLEEANSVLQQLKVSQIDARAVLIP